MKAKGFTLIELMIVIVIISILAGIAIPAYNGYVLRSKLAEPPSILSPLQARMEQYYQDNRNYGVPGGVGCGIPNTNLGNQYFTYACTDPTGTNLHQNFGWTATGMAGTPTAGYVYTITETGAKSTTIPAGTVTACWSKNETGGC